jgi:hypothetical protein
VTQAEPRVREEVRGDKLPGRGAGTISIHVAASESAHFALRVDVRSGDWIAVDETRLYRCPDKAHLERHMRDLVRAQRQVTWRRYLVVEYEAEGPGTFAHRKRYERGEERGDRHGGIGSIRLDWTVVDVSDSICNPGQGKPRRKDRLVYERSLRTDPDGSAGPDEHYGPEGWLRDDKLPEGAVPFTPERYRLLVEIRRALGELDRRLARLFDADDPDQLAAQIDRAASLAGFTERLLPSGDPQENRDDDH